MMENTYIKIQCQNITMAVETFKIMLTTAAIKNDGKIDKEEQKEIDKLSKYADKFISSVKKIYEE